MALLTACWGLSAGDLDELIVAHQQYIDTMLRKALLDDASELNTVSSLLSAAPLTLLPRKILAVLEDHIVGTDSPSKYG